MDEHCGNMIKRCNKLCAEIKDCHERWIDKGQTRLVIDFIALLNRKSYVQDILKQLEAAKIQILLYLQLSSLDMQDNQRRDISGLRTNMEKVLSGIESLQKPVLPCPPMPSPPTSTAMGVSMMVTTGKPGQPDQRTTARRGQMFKRISKPMGVWPKTLHGSKKTKEYDSPPISTPNTGEFQSSSLFKATTTSLECSVKSTPSESIQNLSESSTQDAKTSQSPISDQSLERTSNVDTSTGGECTLTQKFDGGLGPKMTISDSDVVDKTSVLSAPITETNLETNDAPIRCDSPWSSSWETCSGSDSDDDRPEQVSVLSDDESHQSTQPSDENTKGAVGDASSDTDSEDYDQERPVSWEFSDEALLIFKQLSTPGDDDPPESMHEDLLLDIAMLSAMQERPRGVLLYFQGESPHAGVQGLLYRLQKELGMDGLQCAICISWALGLEDEFRDLTSIAQKTATTKLKLLPPSISDEVEAKRIEALNTFKDKVLSLRDDYLQTAVRSCSHFPEAISCTECREWEDLERSFDFGFLVRRFHYWGWIHTSESDNEEDGEDDEEGEGDKSFNKLRARVQSIQDLKNISVNRPAAPTRDQQLSRTATPGVLHWPQKRQNYLTNRTKEALEKVLDDLDESDWGLDLSDFQDLSPDRELLHRIQIRLLDMFPDQRRDETQGSM